MIEHILSESFNRHDNVKVISSKGTWYGRVFNQDHQWLKTSAGTFNIAHPDVKIYRVIERYEDSCLS
jgi:hypothetical protein